MTDFSEKAFRGILEMIQGRTAKFTDPVDQWVNRPKNPIYLRFDIDDNLSTAIAASHICSEYEIKATFFILNTASYWQNKETWRALKMIQDQGHEIGWHNNVLTEWNKQVGFEPLVSFIHTPLDLMRSHSLTIRGSASHGDPLCRRLNYLNYEVFKECPRTSEAVNFPACQFDIPKVSMHDFGLEYEAYHVPYDLYLSEAGGRGWSGRTTEPRSEWQMQDMPAEELINAHDRIQILTHPQHWKI